MSEGFTYRKRDRRRKTSRWYAVLKVDGGRQFHAASPNTREAAKDLLAELQRERRAGVSGSRTLTLGEYLSGWLQTVRPSMAPATWKQHESICRLYLAPGLGRRPLSGLRVGDVRAYLRRTDLDAQTLRHHRATLRRALADARRDGRLTENVAALAEPPRLDRRERPTLTPDEARRLIDGTRSDRLWACWVVMVTAGLRAAEVLGLQWEDIDGGELHVRNTLHWIDGGPGLMDPKTAKSRRTVPLTAIAIEALGVHRKRQLEERMKAGKPGTSGYVFTTAEGLPCRGENLSARLHVLLEGLGLPRVNPHDLRHTAATIMVAAGVPIEKVAAILGHSSVRITNDLYLHLRPGDLQSAADAMQRAIS